MSHRLVICNQIILVYCIMNQYKSMRTIRVYWNKNATTPRTSNMFQVALDIPFVPDYGCLRHISSQGSDITHLMFLSSNLDMYGDLITPWFQVNNVDDQICQHYFTPSSAVRGGMVTFEILRGVIGTTNQSLQPMNIIIDRLNLCFEIEFYKTK